jgi:hypothetical protein
VSTRIADVLRKYPILAVVPAAIILIVILATVAGTTWFLTGDFSHTEFLVRAIPRHPPLIGVAARVRDLGSTPGPSMAYLLYPFYKLFGSTAFALVAAVDLLHVAAIAGAVLVAKRVGGASIAVLTALSLTVVVVALAPRFFLEPWNVWVPLFAFAFFLILVWGLVCEHVALLPIAVAVGSHCVQTHISYTVLVGGLLGGTVAWLGVVWWRTDRLAERHPLRWLLIGTATLIVAWLPPVIEQLRPGTGNLRKLYEQFTDPGEPFVGSRAAVKAMIGRFNLLGPWIIDAQKDPLSTPNYVGFVLFAALVAFSARLAWKRRERIELSLYAVLIAATVLGLFSTMRIFGVFFEYVIRWMLPLVALWVATCVWSCWLSWRARAETSTEPAEDRKLQIGIGIVVACATVLTAVGVVRAASAEVPYQRDSAITGALAKQLETSLDPAKRYQINEVDPVALGSVAFGLALELEKHSDVHAGIGPWGVAGVTPFRVVDAGEADSTLWYVASQPVIDAFMALPGAEVQAFYDPRSEEEVKRSDELQTQLLDALCAAGRDDLRSLLFTRWGHTLLTFMTDLPAEAKPLLQEYSDLRLPAAVIELPVDVDGYLVAPEPPGTC